MSNYIAEQRYDGYHYIAPSSTSTSTPYFTRRNKPHEETKEQEPEIITSSTPSRTIPSNTELTMARITQLCRQRDDMYTTPELNDVLILNEMSIGEIKNLESFPHLITLFLNNNSITHISGLSHMTSLRSLFLQHNMITSMSGLESLTTLVTLNLSHNAITSIDIDMSRFTSLQTLDLSNNQIHDISRISTCTSIKVLNLAHNHLHDPIILTSTLPSLPYLRCLYLHHNPTLITATTQYRRMCMAHISTLTFLDDRPVTQHDRDASIAWLHGGSDAERVIRQQQSETKAEREQRQYDAWKQAREKKKHVIQETMVGYTHWEEEKQQPDVEEDETVTSTPTSTSTAPETVVVEDEPEINIDESTLPPIFSASELALQASLATSERVDDLFNVLSHPTLDTYLSDIARTVPILTSDDDSDTEIEIYQVPDHVVSTRWGNEAVTKNEPGNDATITKNEPILEVDVVDTLPSEASHPAPIRTNVDITSPTHISPHHHKQDVHVDKEKEKTTTTTTEQDDDVDVFAEIQPSTLTMTSTYPRNRAWAWMERDVQEIATSTSSPTKSHATSASTSTSTSTSDDIHVDMDLIELRMREYVQQQMSSMSVVGSKADEKDDVEDDAFWEELRQIQQSEKQSS